MEKQQQVRKENKMGTMEIDRLLITMSTPMIISMAVQALYNVVDSIFVSWVSEKALTAVSLCFPIQQLIIACTVGTGIGVNSILSKSLGEKNYDDANRITNVAIFLSICIGFVFMLVGIFGSRAFIQRQIDDPEIIKYAIEYMSIVCIFSIPLCLQVCFEKILSSTGMTVGTMITQAVGAIANIILDPIFIFYFKMDVKGAAIATVAGQAIGMFFGLYLNIAKNKDIVIDVKQIRPDMEIIKRTYAVGFPAILMQGVSSLVLFGFNNVLLKFSATTVAFFGVFFKLQTFIILPIIGLANGLVPIVAYNYGARDRKRIMMSIGHSLKFSFIMAAIGVLLFQIFPAKFLALFKASDEMLKIGVPAVRIISPSYLFASITIILSSVFQALGSGVSSMITSMIRQAIVLLPLSYYFAVKGNITMVWVSFIISELIAFVVSILFTKLIFKKLDFDEQDYKIQ